MSGSKCSRTAVQSKLNRSRKPPPYRISVARRLWSLLSSHVSRTPPPFPPPPIIIPCRDAPTRMSSALARRRVFSAVNRLTAPGLSCLVVVVSFVRRSVCVAVRCIYRSPLGRSVGRLPKPYKVHALIASSSGGVGEV